MNQVAVGVDIGGTTTKIALVTKEGEILEQMFFSTWQNRVESDFYDFIWHSINELNDNLYEIVGIGIGAPSTNMQDGTIENAANLPFKGIVRIVKNLSRITNLPVYLVKDSFAAAYGEVKYGGAKDLTDFVFLTLGTGFGCAVFANGKPILGIKGLAGELAHTRVNQELRQCGCGKEGCLETFLSATGLKRTALNLMSTHLVDSKMRGYSPDALTSKLIYEIAAQGDSLASEVFRFTAQILGEKLADIAATFSPQAIFISGGLTGAKEYILDDAKEHMEKNLLPFYRKFIKVELSELPINKASLLGASSLVWA